MTDYDGVYSAINCIELFAADADSSYDVRLTVADSFGSASSTLVVSVGVAIMHWLPRGLGMAIGKIATLLNTLELGWRIHMNGNKITGLPAPTEDDEAVNWGTVKDVVENPDNLSAALLWENASPTSTFAEQTIPLVLSDYQSVAIECRFKTDSVQMKTHFGNVGTTIGMDVISPSGYRGLRNATVSETGIAFKTATYNDNDGVVGYIIPTKIFGINGITNPGLEAAKLYELKNEMVYDGTQSVINTGVQLFDIAKDFTILMDATGSANYNLCLLDAARDSATKWKGGVQFKTNPSWNGVGLRVCGYPQNGSAQVFPIVESTERTKMAVVYVRGVPSKFYFRTASAGGITSKNPDSDFGSWDYVQHDGTVSIGGTASGTEKFIGTIHGCSIYNMVLPENEINKRLEF